MDISRITVNKQSSILIDTWKKIYIDPYDIGQARHDADYIFLTHDHYDHMSIPDIQNIMKDDTVFIAPEPMEGKLSGIAAAGALINVVPGGNYQTSDFSFETIPAYNVKKRFHQKDAGWCGYVITVDDTRIYIAGDTDATDEAAAVKCDIALVPIGGTFTMDYSEAARLINTIRPKVAIPTHYGDLVGSRSDGENFKKLVNNDIEVRIVL